MKRVFDLVLASIATVVLAPAMMLIALAVKLTSPGPVLHWSERVGRGNRTLKMPKFRTMRIDTPHVASHLLADPDAWLTSIGGFLRRYSLDELPQLWCILKGDMSFVGPRPALYNQHDLIAMRTERGIDGLMPGLTGWAQINGRDETPVVVKVGLDTHYLRNRSFLFDLKIMALTFWKVLRAEGVGVPPQVQEADGPLAIAAALFESGNIWFGKQQYDLAIRDYDQAIRLDPASSAVYRRRSLAWGAKGEPDKAIRDYAVAIRRQPELADVLRTEQEAMARQYSEAFADLAQIELPLGFSDRAHSSYSFPIRLRPDRISIDREQFLALLGEKDIHSADHPRRRHLRSRRDAAVYVRASREPPAAVTVSKKPIALPLYPGMLHGQQQRVIRAVRELCARFAVEAASVAPLPHKPR